MPLLLGSSASGAPRRRPLKQPVYRGCILRAHIKHAGLWITCRASPVRTAEFTRQLNAEFSEDQKWGVVEMLWRVSLADGRIDAHEGHLVRKVAGLLHVRDRDLVRLRLKVEAEKASS